MEGLPLAEDECAAAASNKKGSSPGINLRILEAAMEATNEAILITNAELDEPGPRIEYANPAFTRLTGYAPEEVLGRSPRLLQGARTERHALDADSDGSRPPSPTRSRPAFRFDVGHHSEMKPATR